MGVRRYLILDPNSRRRPQRDFIELTHTNVRSHRTQGQYLQVKEKLASPPGRESILRDILPYNRCAVTLSHDPREIRGYTWPDNILQLAAGGPASPISRFRVSARSRASRTSSSQIGITWGLVLRREDPADRAQPLEQYRGDSIQDDMATGIRLLLLPVLFVGSLRVVPGRLSGMWTLFFLDWRPVLLRLSRVEGGVVCGGYDAVWSGFDGLSMISASGFPRRNCNPGNESISPSTQRWEFTYFAPRFFETSEKRGYGENVYLRHAFGVTSRRPSDRDSLCYRYDVRGKKNEVYAPRSFA